ncbi:MAG: hypothetical protein ACERKV_05245, partial [Clostridiaceae bacterium]
LITTLLIAAILLSISYYFINIEMIKYKNIKIEEKRILKKQEIYNKNKEECLYLLDKKIKENSEIIRDSVFSYLNSFGENKIIEESFYDVIFKNNILVIHVNYDSTWYVFYYSILIDDEVHYIYKGESF